MLQGYAEAALAVEQSVEIDKLRECLSHSRKRCLAAGC